MAASDIPLARQALAALRAGSPITRAQREALARVDAIVLGRKPLSAYSARTQRRYLAAAKSGATARTANRVEYNDKVGRRTGSTRRQRIYRLAAELDTHELPGAGNVFDQDQIDHLIDAVGIMGTLFILTQQLDSIQHYRAGDSAPGRGRFFGRAAILDRYRKGMSIDEYATPYFYYRSMK
jgi:hypothetical protein